MEIITKDRSEIHISNNKKENPKDKILYSINQMIVKARMLKKPIVIVEGADDIKIYQRIASSINKEIEVRAIENIKGYSEGSDNVIKCIKDAQSKINENKENIKYIRGIIDRDVRPYRGDNLGGITGLFVLKYYSIESHFVTDEHIKYLFENAIGNSNLVNSYILNYIKEGLSQYYDDLYYISLEALKNACERDYHGAAGYDFSVGKVTRKEAKKAYFSDIAKKKSDLVHYASTHNISKDELKLFVKGKWLLEAFVLGVMDRLNKLEEHCKNRTLEGLKQCQYCENNKPHLCQWRINKYFQEKLACMLVLKHISTEEINYIIDDFRTLA